MFPEQTSPPHSPNGQFPPPTIPGGFLRLALGPTGGRLAGFTEEYFQTQLMESAGPGRQPVPPASAEAIASLPRRAADEAMLGDHAECTICMDEVRLGDFVTQLFCKHWFHTSCISVWLNEHNTCPHCRMSIEDARKRAEAANSTYPASTTATAAAAAPECSGYLDDVDNDDDKEEEAVGVRRGKKRQRWTGVELFDRAKNWVDSVASHTTRPVSRRHRTTSRSGIQAVASACGRSMAMNARCRR